VFKYIVNGPKNQNKENDEDQDEIVTDNNKIFDDI
jgi:hypothetical protein